MSDKDTVTFKYKFSDDYNPLYANGAYGGISARGEIVIHFYLERTPVVRKQVNQLTPDGRVGDIVEVEPDDVHTQIIRFVQTGVVLDRKVAKQLHSWLGKQLESLEGGDNDGEHS